MRSRIHLINNSAFTLFEVLVVMGLILAIGSFSLFLGFDDLRKYSWRGERDELISLIQHARSMSVSNICNGTCQESKPHGVYIEPEKFILFQGQDYSRADHDYDLITETSRNIEYSGQKEIIFQQLSGDALQQSDITLIDKTTEKTSIINISSEGRVSWTD